MLLQLFLSVLVTAAATDRHTGIATGYTGQIYQRVYFRRCSMSSNGSHRWCRRPLDLQRIQLPFKENECLLLYPSPHWWQADVGRFTGFKVVRIYTTANRNPLTELTVTVDNIATCATRKFRTLSDNITFSCLAYGRFFKISSNLPVQLCKIKVWGDVPDVPRYELIDPACTLRSPGNGTVESHPAGCQEACAMRAFDSKLPYFNLKPHGDCRVSKIPYGMKHYLPIINNYKPITEVDLCRELCIGTRRFCVLQLHMDNSVRFNVGWSRYVEGFGNSRNFWKGLEWLHRMTSKPGNVTFRAELTDWNNRLFVAEYSGFKVYNASTNYTMDYDAFLRDSSNVTYDSLSRGRQFSTTDRDNDNAYYGSCSHLYSGAGWWFPHCGGSNPNGRISKNASSEMYMFWRRHQLDVENLKEIRLLIQRFD